MSCTQHTPRLPEYDVIDVDEEVTRPPAPLGACVADDADRDRFIFMHIASSGDVIPVGFGKFDTFDPSATCCSLPTVTGQVVAHENNVRIG